MILFNFQGPGAVSLSVDSLSIISHSVLFVKHFLEIFLDFLLFAAPLGDSLVIIPPVSGNVNTFFEKSFNFLLKRCGKLDAREKAVRILQIVLESGQFPSSSYYIRP